jgi:hypothetical protein
VVQNSDMVIPDPHWTIRHFSQSNPMGAGQDNVPALLRRVAQTVEGLGPVDVIDVTFHTEITGEGGRHSMTVYYHFTDAQPEG